MKDNSKKLESSYMEELYRENGKIVNYFLLSLCHDDNLAEELTQETFLKAFQSLDRYNGDCKLSTWLCQIAKHLYFQYLAKRKREVPMETLAPEGQDGNPLEGGIQAGAIPGPGSRALGTEDTVMKRMELLQMLKEMQKLPAQMREVIYLRTTAELSFREIGEILGRSENWARVNFYRGKEMLVRAAKETEWE